MDQIFSLGKLSWLLFFIINKTLRCKYYSKLIKLIFVNQRELHSEFAINFVSVLILGIPGQRGEKGEKVRRFILFV